MKKIPNSWVTPIRLIYTYAFNLYAWYWLYKLIWVLPFDWENIVAWTFACLGMWFFVLDTDDLAFKKKMNSSSSYPDLMNNEKGN
jgi:hypothetical protein